MKPSVIITRIAWILCLLWTLFVCLVSLGDFFRKDATLESVVSSLAVAIVLLAGGFVCTYAFASVLR